MNTNNQKTFPFLPEVERNKHVAEFRWTKMLPGQEVESIHTEVWYEKASSVFSGGGIGYDEDEPDIKHERKIKKRWHVYILPVLVSEYGNEFRLPDMFEVINGIDGPVKFSTEELSH